MKKKEVVRLLLKNKYYTDTSLWLTELNGEQLGLVTQKAFTCASFEESKEYITNSTDRQHSLNREI